AALAEAIAIGVLKRGDEFVEAWSGAVRLRAIPRVGSSVAAPLAPSLAARVGEARIRVGVRTVRRRSVPPRIGRNRRVVAAAADRKSRERTGRGESAPQNHRQAREVSHDQALLETKVTALTLARFKRTSPLSHARFRVRARPPRGWAARSPRST